MFKLFCLAFGFGWNALVNEGGAWAGRSRTVGPAVGGEEQTPAR